MERSNEILTELLEIAPGLKNLRTNPYGLSQGYFDDFMVVLMQRISREQTARPDEQGAAAETYTLSPLLASLRDKQPYSIPDGYFEGLEKKIPFEIPVDKLETILRPVPAPAAATTNSAKKPSGLLKFVRYAAAACIVAMLGITALKLSVNRNIDPIKSLNSVSDQDMANYLDNDDVHWNPGPAGETVTMDLSDNDIHELLNGVSDAELQNYFPVVHAQTQPVN